ncbi:nuclear transport factor 2 family protein [Phycicoccus sonneratiae]|uniref:Nuclear transport factor 2 family protein n=1 Tax=Phycicoccus sonneratiae TaxID=2807628 RepID=A0ABS2CP04_9MICO|nr:nuclear transport factor 2 family protein [Phycicoccus sonneraticus]MBM6401573.1 nuclear transport factor 2 family protein [Phycicoccus sonneraticus]
MSHAQLVRDFLEALESGEQGEALARFWSDDVRTVTHPNLVAPRGGSSDRAAMVAASVAGAGLLAGQRFHVLDVLEAGDAVVVRLDWTGELAVDAGSWPAGTVLHARVAQFVTVADGRIARLETYDCYDPVEV